MIGELVPRSVRTAETRADVGFEALFPEEAAAVGAAVEKRRREFAAGRACARRALAGLGVAPVAIPSGARGEPLWPAGVVGSITHCDGYRACAVALACDVASVGIDAEVHAPLPDGVLEAIATPGERRVVDGGVRLDRVLFSAKESVYKAWFPLAGTMLGFEDVEVALGDGTFRARVLVPGPMGEIAGRWGVVDGFVLSAAVVGRT